MNCPNCRSQILDRWLCCPQCGNPSPSAAQALDGPPTTPSSPTQASPSHLREILICELTPMKGFIRTLIDDEKEEWYDRAIRHEFYTIIDENVDRLRRLIDDLFVGKDFEPEDIEFESEPDKLQNILQNFVSNAIKYSPDGGEVRIIARV